MTILYYDFDFRRALDFGKEIRSTKIYGKFKLRKVFCKLSAVSFFMKGVWFFVVQFWLMK